ncbi:MAG: DNA polymerase III subunit delta [Planctomycetales bacterium]
MQAIEFLKAPQQHATGPLVALYGPERFLKHEALQAVTRLVLGEEGDDLAVARFPGAATDLATVLDALRTVSMWNPRQVVVVEDADEFVTNFREGLEKYLEHPAKKSVLVLELRTFASNTRLAKKVASVGLPIDCAALKAAELNAWLAEMARTRHGKKLDRGAAQMLVDLAGTELGLLDQELGKLAAYVGSAATINAAAVEKLVGGWKSETTWKMLDAVRDGRLPMALELLDKLLIAGEAPLKLLGGIHFVYRPIARATELTRTGGALAESLAKAGVKPFAIQAVTAYLRRIGRPKAERILRWLLQADLDLKGASQLSDRQVLERLLVQLAGKRGGAAAGSLVPES